jgi:hypothetical protein
MVDFEDNKQNKIHYFLKCKLVVKETTYLDSQSKGEKLMTERFVYLIPELSTQRDLFLSAWLPETPDKGEEIGLMIGAPVNGFVRACLKRKNKNIDNHHIFVMSRGAEEDLKDYYDSKKGFLGLRRSIYLDVEVLGDHEENSLDGMKDFEIANKKHYETNFQI